MGRIDDFAGKFKEGVRATLFEVTGTIPGESQTSADRVFFIKAASMPASTIGVVEVPYLGRRIKLPGDRTFAEWTITVMMDEENRIRGDFASWSDQFNDHSDIYGTAQAEVMRPTWSFKALKGDGVGVALGQYNMINCFPTEVGPAEFSYESNDTLAEFTVTLQYDYWTQTSGGPGGVDVVL